MNENVWPLILLGGGLLAFLLLVTFLSKNYSLNNFKSKTVGDGQHGTARWATPKEIHTTYHVVPFRPRRWRKGEDLPTVQGIILGSMGGRKRKSKGGILLQTSRKLLEKLRRPTAGKKEKRKPKKKQSAISKIKNAIENQQDVRALVDSDDIHCLMIGASGVGKTAYFLYANLEYASACGMSYLALDTKGDLARNYGAIASRYYGYKVSVIDLRNPTRSDGFNFLTLMNHYMDIARMHPENLAARARAEKYAKILAKTIINPDGDAAQYGENAFFYDSAEGLLTAIVLLLAEFAPPKDGEPEKRHIVSAFKLVQDLLAVPKSRGKNGFQLLMDELPPEHKARWLAGAALTSADQSMASVMSTVMSRLNAFLDTELEQVICYDSPINAEMFASEKCAIFLILPEEDLAKNFIAALMIQNLSRELFSVADETGGRLKNRVVLFCDELGTMPPFDILPLFSAGRSRRLTLVPIIQSLAQLEKNYGKEGAEIICDNCQDTIFGGFSPQSKTADALSSALGSRTVLSGSVSQGKESSQSLQMIERPLMTPDELKSVPKGEFVVMKTGAHPMRTRLRLFLDWGITFEKGCPTPKPVVRRVAYAGCKELIANIRKQYAAEKTPYNAMRGDKR
ncbi:MAG TPA: type IV secretory system conjugative DNA transfer family protein [Clostridiales bacterium]|nr:type IV secretory system conjugative DNA transfer family protein [Clostridiales bacterium]